MPKMESLVSYGALALPTVFITLALLAALTSLAWQRFGIALTLLASLCLFATATPALSSYLLRQAESGLPRDPDLDSSQAIVVLGGDVRVGDGSAIPDRLGPLSLERVMLAVAAYRRLHLQVAVSGGRLGASHRSVAALMQRALERDFGVPVKWVEKRSRTTWENAVDTARLLRPDGINTVIIVTNVFHLNRALWSFRRAGLHPLPWPAPLTAVQAERAKDFLPNLEALLDSFYGLHELIGIAYYRLRY